MAPIILFYVLEIFCIEAKSLCMEVPLCGCLHDIEGQINEISVCELVMLCLCVVEHLGWADCWERTTQSLQLT